MANDQTVYGAATYGGGVYSPNTIAPTGVQNPETTGLPALTATNATTPASIADTERIGSAAAPAPTFNYGAGTYGANVYSGQLEATYPGSIVDHETLNGSVVTGGAITDIGYGSGLYGDGVYPGTTQRTGYSVLDGETVGAPTLSGAAVTIHEGYGSGIYGDGSYQGSLPNPGGAATPPAYDVPVVTVYPPALHIMGIGPWNPIKVWRGARNYGIGKGIAPARPQMQLPGITAKSFTLRLDGGNEATATCQYPRGAAMVVDELATDLWWRRRDPHTGKLESIARFNCSHNDLSYGSDGMLSASLQFQDYYLLLGNRMVLKYLTTIYNTDGTVQTQESQWPTGTSVTSILKWAIPTNMGIDLTALDDVDLLGELKSGFYLPASTTIADTMKNLQAISSKTWEWWVDTPADVTLPPKLTFIIGTRGKDKGVTLFDYGVGPTPIASWSMRATSDSYANALYFQGKDGGYMISNPAQITEYGQRDALVTDSTVAGTQANYLAAAEKALKPLGDRRPTFTVVLKSGWWRGRAHIDVGDTVRLRIRLGKEDLSYEYRVSEIQADVDANEEETVTLTLGTPLPSANPRSQYSPIFKLVRKIYTFETPTNANSSTLTLDPSTNA